MNIINVKKDKNIITSSISPSNTINTITITSDDVNTNTSEDFVIIESDEIDTITGIDENINLEVDDNCLLILKEFGF